MYVCLFSASGFPYRPDNYGFSRLGLIQVFQPPASQVRSPTSGVAVGGLAPQVIRSSTVEQSVMGRRLWLIDCLCRRFYSKITHQTSKETPTKGTTTRITLFLSSFFVWFPCPCPCLFGFWPFFYCRYPLLENSRLSGPAHLGLGLQA